ncbi:hypothetical protein B0H13DRAFT_1872423 [Mycena leptocephala]|nr:hypothetical protein B0H13DRAFT_1872423 [Mycena leptocephala]
MHSGPILTRAWLDSSFFCAWLYAKFVSVYIYILVRAEKKFDARQNTSRFTLARLLKCKVYLVQASWLTTRPSKARIRLTWGLELGRFGEGKGKGIAGIFKTCNYNQKKRIQPKRVISHWYRDSFGFIPNSTLGSYWQCAARKVP